MSRLDPLIEWAAAHHWRVALILVALILLVGLIEVPLGAFYAEGVS